MITQDLSVRINRDGQLHRRAFLRNTAIAAGSVTAMNWMVAARLQAEEMRKRGMACILLFHNGGPSQYETFDPKPGTEAGGPTKTIDTALPGIQFGEDWPKMAKQIKDFTLIRSMTGKEGNHIRAQYLMHTGYVPSAAVKYPNVLSAVAQELADPGFDLPQFVNIGGAGPGSGGGVLGAGYLPTRFTPFVVDDPSKMPTNTELPAGVNVDRMNRRLGLLDELETDFKGSGAKQVVENNRSQINSATKIVTSPLLKAFDVSQEKESLREQYGKSAFGQGCIMARRLVEVGVPVIEITNSPVGAQTVLGWDTHSDNFAQHKRLAAITDPASAALIADLKDRGMLEKTLVIWMGEFGRTPSVNGKGGRDHYPKAFSIVMAGAGIKGGFVLGATDAKGHEVSERPVKIPDLFCTFCTALKIDPRKENQANGRPMKIVEAGETVKEIFS